LIFRHAGDEDRCHRKTEGVVDEGTQGLRHKERQKTPRFQKGELALTARVHVYFVFLLLSQASHFFGPEVKPAVVLLTRKFPDDFDRRVGRHRGAIEHIFRGQSKSQ
jgi:hypothetical protein